MYAVRSALPKSAMPVQSLSLAFCCSGTHKPLIGSRSSTRTVHTSPSQSHSCPPAATTTTQGFSPPVQPAGLELGPVLRLSQETSSNPSAPREGPEPGPLAIAVSLGQEDCLVNCLGSNSFRVDVGGSKGVPGGGAGRGAREGEGGLVQNSDGEPEMC
jgi:hypothetical protein